MQSSAACPGTWLPPTHCRTDVSIVDGIVSDVSPGGLAHVRPRAERLEPPGEHELRLLLLGRDHSNDVFVEPGRHGIGVDVRDEAVLVGSLGEFLQYRIAPHGCGGS